MQGFKAKALGWISGKSWVLPYSKELSQPPWWRACLFLCFTCSLPCKQQSGAKKDSQNQKSHEQHQLIFWSTRGVTGSLPSKTRVLRKIAPQSSPERSAKSLSRSFVVVTFLSPKKVHETLKATPPSTKSMEEPRLLQRKPLVTKDRAMKNSLPDNISSTCSFLPSLLFWCVPPCVTKLVLWVPFFYGGRGAGGQQIQDFAWRRHEANPSSGAQSEAPGRTREPGHQQHQGPENQDSQHKLKQFRGSCLNFFPGDSQVAESQNIANRNSRGTRYW